MKRTSKKQIRELEEMARETIDASARLYARHEKDATGNAYALINGRTYIYKSNSAMYDAVADMVLYPDETAAAQDEAEKAIAEACKAIEAAASGDAAAIAEHYGAAEEHADNARNHARKAHTYAADARAEWSGEGLYRIAWSDGGQKSDPHHYETAEELAADLTSAYQHATETHQPYAERLEYYERAELLAYLGEPSDFDLEAIEAEATDTDEHGARYWTADAEELEAIAQRNRR